MQTTAHETIKESLGIKSPQENVITIKKQTVIGMGKKIQLTIMPKKNHCT